MEIITRYLRGADRQSGLAPSCRRFKKALSPARKACIHTPHTAPPLAKLDLLSSRTVGRRNRFLKLVYCRLIMGRGFGYARNRVGNDIGPRNGLRMGPGATEKTGSRF